MLLYAAVKYLAYALWCYFGLRLFATQASAGAAFKYGAIRWMLGLFLGFSVGLALGSVDPDRAGRLYFFIYTPLRVVEWGVIAVLMLRTAPLSRLLGARTWLWIAGGIAVSFLSDLVSPEGLAGKFCAGRCLC
jgi:hypothetical protein